MHDEYVHNIIRAWRQERHAAKQHLRLAVGAFGPAFKHPTKCTTLLLKTQRVKYELSRYVSKYSAMSFSTVEQMFWLFVFGYSMSWNS